MRMSWTPEITPEEIERIKKMRDSGIVPLPHEAEGNAAAAPGPPQAAGNHVPKDEPERSRLNGREQAGLYSLGGANELLAKNVPDGLTKRLKKLGLWWRFKGLTKQLRNVQLAVQESAEKEQFETINKRCQHISVYVGMDRVGDPEGTWVRIPDLNTVCGAVLSDTCGLCVKDAGEADHCELRRALRAMTTISSREINPARNGCIFKSMTIMEQIESDEGLGIRD